MSSILIDHPNRLGDHIILNGLVREYCKQYDRVGIFTIPKYLASVSYLFRDLTNLEIKIIKTHRDKQLFIRLNALHLTRPHYGKTVHILTDQESGVLFERQYYALAGVPFNNKWNSFYIERDPAREQALFEKVAPKGLYQFVHDDHRYPTRTEMLNPKLPVVRPEPGITDNFFDWCLVIEKAAEVHVIDSSFMFLTDLLTYDNPEQKLFVHRYSRQPNVNWNMPVLKKPWHILV